VRTDRNHRSGPARGAQNKKSRKIYFNPTQEQPLNNEMSSDAGGQHRFKPVAGTFAESMKAVSGKKERAMSHEKVARMSLLLAMTIVVGACGAGGATRASTIAAGVTPAAQSSDGSGAMATTLPASATTGATQAHPQGSTRPKQGTAAAPSAVTQAPRSTTAVTASPAPSVTAPAPTTPALPARRQPTAAELNQVIASVHALIPLFTPTPAQIAKAGNDVCTAFDQGKTVAQVKATAMQMAGAYAALIPAGVADSALRTIVTLFCPGYSSKLG
jgi:hypothetical protein